MRRNIQWTAVLALFLGVTGLALGEEGSGTIKSVNIKGNQVVLKGILSDSTYELNKDAAVTLDGAQCKLADLKANDRAVIVYEKKGDHMMASYVRGLRKAQETSGTVADVFKDKKEVTIKGTISNTTFELDKSGAVWIDGKNGKLTSIHRGDEVRITWQQRGDHRMAYNVSVLKKN